MCMHVLKQLTKTSEIALEQYRARNLGIKRSSTLTISYHKQLI